MSLLAVTGVEKSFGGVNAVADLDFGVEEGQIYSVIGPNGAGKTTLFNMLSGIYTPSAGEIRFDGTAIGGLEPHRIAALGVSRTFQNLQIFFNMDVLENVMVGCHRRAANGIYRAALRLPGVVAEERRVREWAAQALDFCGLADLRHRPSAGLPYGALKKLEIARALASRIRDSGVTILLVEHNMGLVMQVSDRVLVLDYGRKLTEGGTVEVQNDPRVIAAYLGEEVAGELG